MVRHYKRTSNNVHNDRKKIFAAVREIRIHKKSLRRTAKKFGMQFNSLRYHLLKYSNVDVEDDNALLAYENAKQVFTPAMENEILSSLKDGNQIKRGLNTKDIGRIAYKYAQSRNLAVPKNWIRSKMAGKDWVILFKRRHKIPKHCAKSQSTQDIEMFFENLITILSSYNLVTESIYNLMEIVITASNEPNRIIMQKNKNEDICDKLVDKGKLVTMAATTSASGVSLPPFFIFPKNHHCTDLQVILEDLENKWTSKEFFLDYLQHFVVSTGCSTEKPHLLILDYHECYELSNIKEFTKANGIVLLSISSQYSQKLQPFEVSLLPSFKNAFNKIAKEWVTKNPNQSMSVYDIPKLVAEIYLEVFCKKNIQTGFHQTRIHPLKNSIMKKLTYMKVLNPSTTKTDSNSKFNIQSEQSHEENLQVSVPGLSAYYSSGRPKRVIKKRAYCTSFCSHEKSRKENTKEKNKNSKVYDVDKISCSGKRVILNQGIKKKKIDMNNKIKTEVAIGEGLSTKEIFSNSDQIKEAITTKTNSSNLTKFRKKLPKKIEPKILCTESNSLQENIMFTKNIENLSITRPTVEMSINEANQEITEHKLNKKAEQIQNVQFNDNKLISTKERLLMKILEKIDKNKISKSNNQQNSMLNNDLKKNRSVLSSQTMNVSDSYFFKNNKTEKIELSKENENLKKTEESNKYNLEREIHSSKYVEDMFESRESDIYDFSLPCDQIKEYSVKSLNFIQPHKLHTSTAEHPKEKNCKLNFSSEQSVFVEYIPNNFQKENSADNLNNKEIIFPETIMLSKKMNTKKKNNKIERDSLEEKKLIIREIIQSIASKRK